MDRALDLAFASLPSLVVLRGDERCVAACHACVPADVVLSLPLTDRQVHLLQNADYGKPGKPVSKGREVVPYEETLAFMRREGVDLCVGGHQDRVECVALVGRPPVDDGWERSPSYPSEDDCLYVRREVCRRDGEACRPVDARRTVPLPLPFPAILKTSSCYTGKRSVTGACYLVVAGGEVAAVTLPPRPPSNFPVREPPLSTRRGRLPLSGWEALARRLPVLYGEEALAAYATTPPLVCPDALLSQLCAVRRQAGAQARSGGGGETLVAYCGRDVFHVVGDIHSNLHALVDILIALRDKGVVSDNGRVEDGNRLIFCGDYAQRGPYGTLVLSLLFSLYLLSPGRVFLVKGNHERRHAWHARWHRDAGLITELDKMTDVLLQRLQESRIHRDGVG